MRADLIVVLSPLFDQHFRLLRRVEDLFIQELVRQLSIDTLFVAVLPWAARFNDMRLHVDPPEPASDGLGCEPRPVVGADVVQSSALREQLDRHLDYIVGPNAPGNKDGQAFSYVFIDKGHDLSQGACR